MNTHTESLEKIYLVSFGNSGKYILHDEASGKDSRLTKVEAELNSFLRKRFPDESFAYFTTPRVDEISNEDATEYASYPLLDSAAVDQIKDVLVKEVEDMEATRRINRDAPYSDVNPAAADIPHIL